MVLEVSKAGWPEREKSRAFCTYLMRGSAFESSSAIGRGTSEASGAWPRRVSGSLEMRRALTGHRTGDLRLPAAAKDRQGARQADSLRGLGRDGP